MKDFLYEYLEWLGQRPYTPLSTKRIIDEIKQKRCAFFNTKVKRKDDDRPQMVFFYRDLRDIDEYTKKLFIAIHAGDNVENVEIPYRFQNTMAAMKQQKQQEISMPPQTSTPWREVYADMISSRRGDVKQASLDEKKQCLETIFMLLDKEYVEQITTDDCRSLNRLIYRVPKKWKENNPNKTLLEVLLPVDERDAKKSLSPTTISKYLTIFQEFIRYCRKQRHLNEDLSDLIDKPKVKKHKNVRSDFTENELKKIFNPAKYCSFYEPNTDNPKFWVPLIALFSGARLNEICQIRLCDIQQENDKWYIQTTDEHELQSLKNPQSRRKIPIHPVLMKMGFIKQVARQRQRHVEFLFDSLNYDKKNKFGTVVGHSFNRYIQNHIKEKGVPRKISFHSFRHTVKVKLRDEAGISAEYTDILCGWEGEGSTGTKTYAHRDKVPVKKLYDMISKLKYPFLDEEFKAISERVQRIQRMSKKSK